MEGRPLTPELVKELCATLGYDFELYLTPEGRVHRFRRIPPKQEAVAGDVW